MVVGNGLIAKKFVEYESDNQVLIFASGVANSKNAKETDYEREFLLLKEVTKANPNKLLVYFSTCSVNDPVESRSEYVKHKIRIEQYIIDRVEKYLICRVSNLVGKSSNPNTVMNYFASHINNGDYFEQWVNGTRNLIDVDDFYVIADAVIRSRQFDNQIINIANPLNYTVPEIVSAIEKYYNKKANSNVLQKGASNLIDITRIKPIIDQLHLQFSSNYLGKLLFKYY